MRSADIMIDRFARKHPRFGIPHLINYILIGNVVIYLLDLFSDGFASALLGLDFGSAILGLQLWRLVTFIFVPLTQKPIWFVVSLFFYYFLGNTMEREWGTAKFTLFYLVGALLTFLGSIVTFFWTGGISYPITLNAIHETLFLAFATLFPDVYLRVYFILPIKAKWLAAFYVFMEIWNLVGMNRLFLPIMLPILLPAMIASWVNYLLFFWSEIKQAVGQAFGRAKHQNSKQTIDFKKATGKIYQEKGYIHKCAVCGKTDTEYPDLEFRYCSKCNGSYCYCMEHINNHVHIQ